MLHPQTRTRRCSATVRCGNSCSSWNTRPMPRRCVGRWVTSTPSQAHRAGVGHEQPGDHAQQRALADPGRAQQGDAPHRRRPASETPSSTMRSPNANDDVTRPRASGARPCGSADAVTRPARRRRPARRPSPAASTARGRVPVGTSPARPSSRSIAIGIVSPPARVRKVVAPNSPSEIAAAKPAPTASGGDDAAARRPPTTPARGEAPSVAAALAAGGRIGAQHRQQARTTNGMATQRVADRDQPPRGPPVDGRVSNVMSMPRPIVTAEVPSGSISPTSSSRPCRLAAAIARRRAPPTHDADQRWPRPRSAAR